MTKKRMAYNRIRRVELADRELRMPTGAVAFGDDWPGIFVRGDECIGYAHALLEVLKEHIATESNIAHLQELAELAELIESCRVVGSRRAVTNAR
jgi:hypothetical protein